MIETEQSKKISNDELLRDIENTSKELEAYQKIADGFRTLATMPENDDIQRRMLNYEADKHRNKETECAKFLKQLRALKAERGL